MRRLRNAMVIATPGLVLWLFVGHLVGQPKPATLDVTCPDPEGCFRRIEQALAEAPPGATVRIGRGLYYEKPLTIDKSLSLIGEGSPEIRVVDPGVGITVQLPQGQEDPMTVTFDGLTISGVRIPGSQWEKPVTVSVSGVPFTVPKGPMDRERLRVIIRDTKIRGFAGITVTGATLVLRDSTVEAVAIAIRSAYARVEIEKSLLRVEYVREEDPFRGDTPVIGVAPQYSRVELRESAVFGGLFGVAVAADDEAVLIGNTIGGAVIGVYITDKANVELRENRFWENRKFGVSLPLKGCVARPQWFQGTVTGANNEFEDNAQDLCPRDYRWPEGFVASTSGEESVLQSPLKWGTPDTEEGFQDVQEGGIRRWIPLPSSLRVSLRAVLLSRPEMFAPGLELETKLGFPSRGALIARVASLAEGWAFSVGIRPSGFPGQALLMLLWGRESGTADPRRLSVGWRFELRLEAALTNRSPTAVYFTELGLSVPILGPPLQPVYRAGFALRF